MSKQKFHAVQAQSVADILTAKLEAGCIKVAVAGSLRRGKEAVGDVEIVYVPNFVPVQSGDLFGGTEPMNAADLIINGWLQRGVLNKRLNSKGSEMWGEKNKLAVHVATGIPVDLFATTEDCWENYMVCRTGGAETNKEICMAANRKGWTWNPYGRGFTDDEGQIIPVTSEREVFELVGLPYLPPEKRL